MEPHLQGRVPRKVLPVWEVPTYPVTDLFSLLFSLPPGYEAAPGMVILLCAPSSSHFPPLSCSLPGGAPESARWGSWLLGTDRGRDEGGGDSRVPGLFPTPSVKREAGAWRPGSSVVDTGQLLGRLIDLRQIARSRLVIKMPTTANLLSTESCVQPIFTRSPQLIILRLYCLGFV